MPIYLYVTVCSYNSLTNTHLDQVSIIVRVPHLGVERTQIVLVIGIVVLLLLHQSCWPHSQWQSFAITIRHILHVQDLCIRTDIAHHVRALIRVLQNSWRLLDRHCRRHFRDLWQCVRRVVRHIRRRHQRRAHVHAQQRTCVVARVDGHRWCKVYRIVLRAAGK